MTEKTDNSASQIDLDKINERFNEVDERFNKIDQDVAVLTERTNNLSDAVKKNSSDLMQSVSDIRADMKQSVSDLRADIRQESNRNLALYAGGLVLYGGLVAALIL